MDRSRLGVAAALGAIAAALAVFCAPLFTSGVSALTGDNLTHSLPLRLDLARILDGAPWRWVDPRTAFGFPFYAEGVNGWLHPWQTLVLAALPELAAHDFLYVSSFFLTGASALLAARALGLGLGAALAAGLATAFSPVVLENLYNASYAHSTAWAAVCVVAFERWWAAPGTRRLGLFAAAVALAVCAGYPPTAYALFLFLGVALATRVALERRDVVRRLAGFAAALALGLGIAAPQVLPLAELATLSVRQEEVEVLNSFPWSHFLGGLVFDPDPALYEPGRYAFFTAPLATVLALVAVPFAPLLRDPRLLGYAAGTFVCVGAASGPGSGVFEVLHAVLPGFDRLRLLSPFLFVAVLPAGVLLGALLEAATRGAHGRAQRTAVGSFAIAFAGFAVLSLPAATAVAWYRELAIALAAAAGLAFATLPRVGRPGSVWIVWIAVLAIEIAVLRTGHRAWLPDRVLDEGRPLAAALAERVKAEPDARAMHFRTQRLRATFDGMVGQHWKSPRYASFVRNGRRVAMPLANLLDELPFAGMSGALALAGYPELIAQMEMELRARSATPPGERAVDRWGVRWVVRFGDLAKLRLAPGMTSVWRDPAGDLELLENAHALPVWQWQAGVAEAGAGDAGTQRPAAWRRAIESLPWVTPETEGPFAWSAAEPGRLFAALPLHPSWTAVLDGAALRPVRAGDGFGMEIPAAAGAHRAELRFVPHALHAGILVGVASLAVFAWLVARRPRA